MCFGEVLMYLKWTCVGKKEINSLSHSMEATLLEVPALWQHKENGLAQHPIKDHY